MLCSVHHNYLWTIFCYFLTTKTIIQCSNRGLNQVSKCLDTDAAALPGSLLGVLYPRRTDSRQVLSLDATWKFRLVPKLDPEIGFRNKWYAQPLETFGYTNDMDVPGDFGHTVLNSQRMLLYPGWVWFERSFSIPKSWFMMSAGNRIFLRISEAHYSTVVYINGIEVMKHEGGGVPFATELSKSVFFLAKGIEDIVESIARGQYEEDTAAVGASRYNTIYKDILNHEGTAPYLTMDIALSKMRVIAQARLSGLPFLRFITDGCLYRFEPRGQCPVCNEEANDNLSHFLTSCKIYSPFRPSTLATASKATWLDVNDKSKALTLFNFITQSLRLRSWSLCE